jgi:hypothetical protein
LDTILLELLGLAGHLRGPPFHGANKWNKNETIELTHSRDTKICPVLVVIIQRVRLDICVHTGCHPRRNALVHLIELQAACLRQDGRREKKAFELVHYLLAKA